MKGRSKRKGNQKERQMVSNNEYKRYYQGKRQKMTTNRKLGPSKSSLETRSL